MITALLETAQPFHFHHLATDHWWSYGFPLPPVSGRTIKRKLEHLVEVRPTRPVRTAFEIIDYFKCEISKKNCEIVQPKHTKTIELSFK